MNHVYIWTEHPADTHGLVPVVRAANGTGHTGGDVDFAANYRAWTAHHGGVDSRLPAWTYMYPGDDGIRVAEALHTAAPHASWYLLDLEDPGLEAREVRRAAEALHQHAPVGVTTYGLRSQSAARRIPLTAYDWQIASPQIYYPYQAEGLTEWRHVAEAVWPSVSPLDWPGWVTIAHHGPVIVWRLGTVDIAHVAALLGHAQGGPAPRPHHVTVPVTDVYPLPVLREGARGAHVRDLQGLLVAHGHPIVVDGAFGANTAHSVRQAQYLVHLTPDGVCGPRTWHALLDLAIP